MEGILPRRLKVRFRKLPNVVAFWYDLVGEDGIRLVDCWPLNDEKFGKLTRVLSPIF